MVKELIGRNVARAERRDAGDPGRFAFASAPMPSIFWLGCCDGRVAPAHVAADLESAEIFVCRNVANVVRPRDVSLFSALEFAVEHGAARDVVVCGHDDCRGVKTVIAEGSRPAIVLRPSGALDRWLEPIRCVARAHAAALARMSGDAARGDALAEWNVIEGVRRIAASPVLQRARRRGADVRVHGLFYVLGTGRVHDLRCTIDLGRSR